MSSDRTWAIVRRLARERGSSCDAGFLGDARRSHALVEGYAGSPSWVFGVDGDELYDPAGLARLRDELIAGITTACFGSRQTAPLRRLRH
jgi:hypothetical protein